MKTIKVFGKTYNLSISCAICHRLTYHVVCQQCKDMIVGKAK